MKRKGNQQEGFIWNHLIPCNPNFPARKGTLTLPDQKNNRRVSHGLWWNQTWKKWILTSKRSKVQLQFCSCVTNHHKPIYIFLYPTLFSNPTYLFIIIHRHLLSLPDQPPHFSLPPQWRYQHQSLHGNWWQGPLRRSAFCFPSLDTTLSVESYP